jgi:hypothetical protein
MANLNSRRRWRGPALGGRLQRGARFCFSAHDGEATTSRLAEWLRPELVYAGRRPTAVQMVNGARAPIDRGEADSPDWSKRVGMATE